MAIIRPRQFKLTQPFAGTQARSEAAKARLRAAKAADPAMVSPDVETMRALKQVGAITKTVESLMPAADVLVQFCILDSH